MSDTNEKISVKCAPCYHFNSLAHGCDLVGSLCLPINSKKFVNGFRIARTPNRTRCISFSPEHPIHKLLMTTARGTFQKKIAGEILRNGYLHIEKYSRANTRGKKRRWDERYMTSVISFFTRINKALVTDPAWDLKIGCVDANSLFNAYYFDTKRVIC